MTDPKEEPIVMQKRLRITWIGFLGALLFTVLLSGTVFAETRTKISSVRLTVTSEIEPGDDSDAVSVETSTDHCTITEVNVTNNNGNWKVGDQPKVEITLTAEDGYFFDAIGKGKLGLSGSKAEYSSYRRKDSNTTIIFAIRLAKLDGDLDLENVEWKDSATPTAIWDDENGASKYQVRLYRESSSVGDAVTVSQKSYNFSGSITREGTYTFKVRAVGSSKKGEWFESDALYISEEELPDIKKAAQNLKNPAGTSSSSGASGGTTSSGNTNTVNGKDGIITPGGAVGAGGSWQRDQRGWWFRYADGTYPKDGWLFIGTSWYCFDGSGYMRTGWIKASDGNYYYCDPRSGSTQGALLCNQETPDGYWVNEKGIWVPGA